MRDAEGLTTSRIQILPQVFFSMKQGSGFCALGWEDEYNGNNSGTGKPPSDMAEYEKKKKSQRRQCLGEHPLNRCEPPGRDFLTKFFTLGRTTSILI